LELKVALFNIIENVRATTFSDKKSRRCSSALERDFGGVLKVSNQKIFLNQFLVTFVSIRVLSDSLEIDCNRIVMWHDFSMTSRTSIVKLFCFDFFLGWLGFASKLVEKVSCSFCRQCCQILGKWIFGDNRGLVKTALWNIVLRVFILRCLLNLLAKESFSLKRHFRSVKTKLLEEVFLCA